MNSHPHLRLFSALAVKAPLVDSVLPAFTAEKGIAVDTTFDPTAVLVDQITAGDIPDVIVCISAALDQLVNISVVDPKSVTPLVQSGIGIAVLAGAPHPSISTVQDLVKTLTSARAVAYSRAGASGKYFASLLVKLGIADEVNANAVIPDKGFIAEKLLDGSADIAIQQLSELATVPGIEIVGALPSEVQQNIKLSAAIGAHAKDNEAAHSLLSYLTSSNAAAAFRNAKLEPVILLPTG